MTPDRRARALLVLGAVGGAGLAAWGLLGNGAAARDAPPEGAVASVNGIAVTEDAFAGLAAAVAAERRETSLDAAERRRLLDRLVDEELLLQRGLELDLPRLDRTARRAVVSAVVGAVTADAETDEPDDTALQAFFAQERERFRSAGRVEVEVLLAGVGPPRGEPDAVAQRRAVEAAARLRSGQSLADVRAALGDPIGSPPPAGEISLDELRAAFGPSAAKAVDALAPGGTSDPVRGAAGYLVLRLVRRAPGEIPPFEAIRAQVRAAYLRSAGERALADYLDELRADAEVRLRAP